MSATGTTTATRADHCVVACAESWRNAGEVLASPMGTIPTIASRLAKLTFSPDLLLTDGEALLTGDVPAVGAAAGVVEGWLPYRQHLALVATGRRQVMMGASQIDRYGNQNISCIGDWSRPRRQLLGVRGAPGNTLNNPTSYWVPRHSARVFVERVDMVCGVGHDRAAAAGPSASRHHRLVDVVTDLGVFDFETPGRTMRLRSLHPGVTVEQVVDATGFTLTIPTDPPYTRDPTAEELRLLRGVIDPEGLRIREVPA
ncbi:CoA-transferase subunit beta [Streptomyces peucetius]|nr:CoA-transferase [Streptomyces peucetius subsp. caesius ATCC 27952]